LNPLALDEIRNESVCKLKHHRVHPTSVSFKELSRNGKSKSKGLNKKGKRFSLQPQINEKADKRMSSRGRLSQSFSKAFNHFMQRANSIPNCFHLEPSNIDDLADQPDSNAQKRTFLTANENTNWFYLLIIIVTVVLFTILFMILANVSF
jgi:hypothetical protein